MKRRQERIGFIGLGTMGAPMAAHLIKTGWDLVVYDIDKTKCSYFEETTNCVIAQSPEEAMKLASRLITILPTSGHVEEVLFGDNGASAGIQSGDIVIEMSTGQIDQLERQAQQIQNLGAILIDAPVCLSPAEAATGNLISLVGGDTGDIERISDLLKALSQRVVHAGPIGYGLRLKLVNNYMSMINHVLTAEVLALAKAAGLDRPLTVDLLQNTAAGRGQLLTNFPKKVLRGDTAADFPINMGIKDLSMAMAMFSNMKGNAVFGPLARQIFDDAAKAGFGGKDCTAVLEYFDEKFSKETLENSNLE
ncbi:NAD(P)-dependent oxidoreductase [Alphaproteobacteria bacterium LSUCC0684]